LWCLFLTLDVSLNEARTDRAPVIVSFPESSSAYAIHGKDLLLVKVFIYQSSYQDTYGIILWMFLLKWDTLCLYSNLLFISLYLFKPGAVSP
jgi:hypothetical protein